MLSETAAERARRRRARDQLTSRAAAERPGTLREGPRAKLAPVDMSTRDIRITSSLEPSQEVTMEAQSGTATTTPPQVPRPTAAQAYTTFHRT